MDKYYDIGYSIFFLSYHKILYSEL